MVAPLCCSHFFLQALFSLACWVVPTGTVRTLAGSTTTGVADGVGSLARFQGPYDIALVNDRSSVRAGML